MSLDTSFFIYFTSNSTNKGEKDWTIKSHFKNKFCLNHTAFPYFVQRAFRNISRNALHINKHP